MFRTGATSSLSRSLLGSSSSRSSNGYGAFRRLILTNQLQLRSQTRVLSYKSPQQLQLALYSPSKLALRRYATIPKDEVERERKYAESKLEPHPELVSEESSVRHAFSETGAEEPEKDVDMMAGVKADLKTIQETFTLKEVPKEALYIGMAGVLPYLGTSLSTLYLAWDLNHAAHTGTGFLLDGNTAEMLLHIIEPIQIGWGAVIISFLGAIHWGLEWANFGGVNVGWTRYRIGLIAPAIAWPTILLPVEYALITQFLAFNYLYFVDAKAAAKGYAPHWYGIYRFVLTFIVGAAIVATLIGRGQVAEVVGHPSNAATKVRELREHRAEYLRQEEEMKEKAMAEGEGEDEGGDDEE